eukprot:UN07900
MVKKDTCIGLICIFTNVIKLASWAIMSTDKLGFVLWQLIYGVDIFVNNVCMAKLMKGNIIYQPCNCFIVLMNKWNF